MSTITTTPDLLQLVLLKDEPRIDSRLLAQQLRRPHYGVFELVRDYQGDFEELGVVRFQTWKPLPQQALLVVAQHVATQALQQADDHRDGYQVAKDAVLNLSRALLLGGAA